MIMLRAVLCTIVMELGSQSSGVTVSMHGQVYGIMSAQLVLTATVAGVILAVPPVRGFVTTSVAFQITCGILPLIGGALLPLQQTQSAP
jgi:FtsH-binding integral membrane protein